MRPLSVAVSLVFVAGVAMAGPAFQKKTLDEIPEAVREWSFLAGDWDTDSKRYSLDGPVVEENKGKARFSLAMQGLRIQERGATTFAGQQMLVMHVFSYHPDKQEWEIARTDSIHHSFSVMKGTASDSKIVLFEKNPNPESDVTRRFTYSRLGDDRFSLLLEFSLDEGETWLRRNETFYTRRR